MAHDDGERRFNSNNATTSKTVRRFSVPDVKVPKSNRAGFEPDHSYLSVNMSDSVKENASEKSKPMRNIRANKVNLQTHLGGLLEEKSGYLKKKAEFRSELGELDLEEKRFKMELLKKKLLLKDLQLEAQRLDIELKKEQLKSHYKSNED